MGNKNNRDATKFPRVAELYARRKLEEKEVAEKLEAEKLTLEKKQTEELIQSLPQHDSIAIEQVGDAKMLNIGLDFINKGFIVDMPSFLETLPSYAPFLNNITIRLYAPAKHQTRAIYKDHIASLMKMVDILNTFNINKLNVIIGLNKDDFHQMKLAAFVHGLKFQKWTMCYHIFDRDGEVTFQANVARASSYSRRLQGVYKAEFMTQ
ncbi:hypothetical protein NHQ30_011536 [Ciborinia camelliae]|nr:hypothetical protein NHQ30_011536 [Ciborinia camelliae]